MIDIKIQLIFTYIKILVKFEMNFYEMINIYSILTFFNYIFARNDMKI